MSERGRTFARLLQMMRLLESTEGSWTLTELSRHFGVTTRTIRRDLEVLRRAGAIIDELPRDGEYARAFCGLEWPRQ